MKAGGIADNVIVSIVEHHSMYVNAYALRRPAPALLRVATRSQCLRAHCPVLVRWNVLQLLAIVVETLDVTMSYGFPDFKAPLMKDRGIEASYECGMFFALIVHCSCSSRDSITTHKLREWSGFALSRAGMRSSCGSSRGWRGATASERRPVVGFRRRGLFRSRLCWACVRLLRQHALFM